MAAMGPISGAVSAAGDIIVGHFCCSGTEFDDFGTQMIPARTTSLFGTESPSSLVSNTLHGQPPICTNERGHHGSTESWILHHSSG
jgi:hypothetical protein